jgi:hypothetical protein
MSEDQKPKPLQIELLDKMTALVTAAFGLVAALAWNEAIKTIFTEVFGSVSTMVPMIIYAVVVTVIAVIATLAIARATSKAKEKL